MPEIKQLQQKLLVSPNYFAPGDTAENEILWVDMKNFDNILVVLKRITGTSDVTFKLQASASSDGSDPEDVATKVINDQPDAVGDQLVLETNGENIAKVGEDTGKDLRYVSAVVSVATGTDTLNATYVLGHARYEEEGLTPDVPSQEV